MKKLFALLLAIVMVAGVFAGCGQPTDTPGPADPTDAPAQTAAPVQPDDSTPPDEPATTGPDGREFADEQVYRSLYSGELQTMNYLASGTTAELVVGANCVDSLVENDAYGNIVPSAAESWDVSADGLTWTFHLRQGQYWYDADGNQKDPVTAHDFVAAARYVCDAVNECSNSYLMEGWVTNAEEAVYYTAYANAAVEKGTEQGEDQDAVIDENGVIWEGKSWDEATQMYTEWVEVPVVTPDQIGVVAVDDYTLEYHLVVPRPYFLTVLQFGTYWPAPAALLEELGTNFGMDNYSMWFNGAYLLSTFEPQSKRIYTKNENNWDADRVYIERIEQTYNTEASTISPELFLRGEIDGAGLSSDIAAEWLADPEKSQMVSTSRVTGDYSYFFGFNFEPTFDEAYEPANWEIAVNNENFRKTIFHAIDRTNYIAARYPGDDPEIHKINCVTPTGFSVYNGKDFTMYGELAKYTTGESFNETLALEYKAKAVEELTAAGATFPIKAPVNYNPSTSAWGNASVVLEQQLEGLLGADFIDIIVVEYAGTSFLNETRRNGNYALQELNWGADFMDPETWADPFHDLEQSYNFFVPDSSGYRVFKDTKTPETHALIDEYWDLVAYARTCTGDLDERYEAFAAAEAFYLDHAIVVPMFISGGSYQATKLNGFEGQFAMMGQATSRYKGQHVYKTAMSMDMYDAQYEAWLLGE